MANNRKMKFVADIEEKEFQKREQIRKEQEIKFEEKKKRQEERENLIFQLQRTQQNLYTQNLDKKMEFIKEIDKLTINDKSSCLIGVFGMDCEKIRSKLSFCDDDIRTLDLGVVEYKNGKSDIYYLIWSQIYNKAYSGNIDKTMRLELENYYENEKTKVPNDYYLVKKICDFADSVLDTKKDINRMFLWIKLYDFDFELIDKIYKIENRKLRIIVSTFWNIDVLKSKLEMEKYPAEKVFNKYFSYNGIKTYIEV